MASRVAPGGLLAALGGVILLVALFLLPWYGVGEGRIAPIEIRAPAPWLHAQLEPGEPPPLPGGPPSPGEPPLPGEPPPLPGEPQPPVVPGDPGALPEGLPAGSPPDDFGAWEAQGPLGTAANIVALLAALAGIGAAAAAAARRLPGSAGWALAALGAAAVVAVALRMLFAPEEIDDFEFEATLELGAFLALGGAIATMLGGLLLGRRPADD